MSDRRVIAEDEMRIGCISWSYRDEFADGTYDLSSWLKHCAEVARLDGVEIWNKHVESLDEKYLKDVSAEARSRGLQVYSLASKLSFGDFSDDHIARVEEDLRIWLQAAHRVGAPILRFSIGGEDLRSSGRRSLIFDTIRNSLEQNERILQGVRIGIENQEPGFIQSAEDVDEMVRVLGGKVGLILDNGSFLDRRTSYDFVRRTVDDALLFHAKFYDFADETGDRVLDYGKMRDLLRASTYRGYLSIEMDSKASATAFVPRIAGYLRRLFGE